MCWENWRQGFNLVRVVSMVLQAFGVYWTITPSSGWTRLIHYKNYELFIPLGRGRRVKGKGKRNEREKFKHWLSWIAFDESSCWHLDSDQWHSWWHLLVWSSPEAGQGSILDSSGHKHLWGPLLSWPTCGTWHHRSLGLARCGWCSG